MKMDGDAEEKAGGGGLEMKRKTEEEMIRKMKNNVESEKRTGIATEKEKEMT